MHTASIGVWFDREAAEKRWAYGMNVFARYIEEILTHAGIAYSRLESLQPETLEELDIVIAALEGDDSESMRMAKQFAERGGTIVSYAGLETWLGELCCRPMPPLEIGYAGLSVPMPAGQLRYLRAVPWAALNQAALVESRGMLRMGSPDGPACGHALQSFRLGAGRVERWAVDIPLTVVGFQQGVTPVFRDGYPAPDGTAATDEGILKADDGIAMDWMHDRAVSDGGVPYFAHPYADLWRQACITHLIGIATRIGKTIPFVGIWPDGIRCVATISHDSDGNDDAHAVTVLELLAEEKVRTTWCMLEPGYSAEVYERVRAAGHELAFHYDALAPGKWGEEEFRRQLGVMTEAGGTDAPTTNKNHFTRFQGWGELFEWCERNGIAVDQTRGPSKKGNTGFLFGTCHPYYPIAWANQRNRFYDVLELGFLTQDLCHPALPDTGVIEPFLQQVREVGGVAHFLFHQVHLASIPAVADAFRQVIARAKEFGFPVWTARQIYDWVRIRRDMTMRVDGNLGWRTENGLRSDGIIIWEPITEYNGERIADERNYSVQYGYLCKKKTLSSTEGGN